MKAAPSSVQYSKHACSRKRGDTYIRGQGYGTERWRSSVGYVVDSSHQDSMNSATQPEGHVSGWH